MQVKVAQQDGTITVLTGDAAEPKTYNVKDGHVNVAADDVPHFLSVVADSSVSQNDAKKLDA